MTLISPYFHIQLETIFSHFDDFSLGLGDDYFPDVPVDAERGGDYFSGWDVGDTVLSNNRG